MNITLRNLEDKEEDYKKVYNWCQNKYVYEWFEQRKLSYEEIHSKYKNKLDMHNQDIFIIKCDEKDIGLVQIYKFEKNINIKEINKYNNIFEYDIFIGEKDYISKGIGKEIIELINNIIYMIYNADAIILRPFKRNIRAIKCYEKAGYKQIYEYLGKDTLDKDEEIIVLLNTKC